jgi:hypothetical protein
MPRRGRSHRAAGQACRCGGQHGREPGHPRAGGGLLQQQRAGDLGT